MKEVRNTSKVSYKSHPIIEKLSLGSLGNMPIFQGDVVFFDINIKSYVHQWKSKLPYFRENIQYMSKSFILAVDQANDKLTDLYLDILKNDTADMNVNGTFISGSASDDVVVMFHHEVRKGSDLLNISMFGFTKEGTPLFTYIDNATVFQNLWISSSYSFRYKDHHEWKQFIHLWIVKIVVIDMFKRYAEVETKILPPKTKDNTIGCQYNNGTKLPITFLDSKWFTTLIKSDSFKVRGHFRLQAHGEGMKQRKLIWVNDFEKSGYTAPARKLNSEV